MFRGRSTHVMDAKGRLSIPARFRDFLRAKGDDRLIVTNLPTCLVAYPHEEWRLLEDSFTRDLFAAPEDQAFQRYFLAAAVECPLDGQGRILVPASLRQEAGLTKEVVLSGMLHYFEIWSKDRLDEELKYVRENFGQYRRSIPKIGTGR